ncbi:MAG: hypothetical protein KJO04_11960 [Bacteroidia bacterium]|nr:hypothetical protein [Bacteroidia bacterium]
MKNTALPCYFICFFVLIGCSELLGQDSLAFPPEKKLKIRDRTVLGQFESNLVLSADERLKKKLERRELIAKRRAIIDTLDISERRRRRLLKELYGSPFTTRWDKVVASMEFEEDPDLE